MGWKAFDFCLFFLALFGAATAKFTYAGDSGHWAWQPVVRPEIPATQTKTHHPIDAFVAAKLESQNWQLSPPAEPHALLRRLHLDLTGLLPTLREIAEFELAWAAHPDRAYAEKVDSLLDSPHFGERWARPWLDLARYADSDGYLGDNLRQWAWLYRDWVINSINRDLPFDRFSIEQLAGDLLPEASIDQKIATGFHRNNLKNTEAGADRELNRTKQIVDRVAVTATAWLGLTMACAECHDHKHDPISQKEFYELYAFFNQSIDSDISVKIAPELREKMQAKVKPGKDGKIPELKPKAQTVADLGAKDRRRTFIHIRGDYAREGDAVTPGTPAILHPMSESGEKRDRLALARWLFQPDNPLTTRVAVNQIWQELFGIGLVSTPDDFGRHGAPPSNPGLLDWLASEYRETHGWSRKAMIRSIVMSSVYRQSSRNRHPGRPNDLLWRQNRFRLSADAVRDAHLAASGLLSRKVGGPGIRPPLPEFVTAVGRSVKWPVDKGADRHRRGLYIFLKRTVLYPMLTTFDAPDTSAACSRREETNTPMQALTLLNDPVFHDCAKEMGKEISRQQDGSNREEAIREIFLRCLNREPDSTEIGTLLTAHRDFSRTEPNGNRVWTAVARIVMNLDEFIHRE